MTGALTTDSLRNTIISLAPAVSEAVPKLNELDMVLGDGDMGATLQLVFKAFSSECDTLPPDIGAAFQRLALSIARTSGSSFSGVVMAALLDASRATAGKTSLLYSELGTIVSGGVQAMVKTGGGAIGDKSILDALNAVAQAITGVQDCAAIASRANKAAQASLADFRNKPCRLGRARLAGERSIGHDDPGMSAVAILTEALITQFNMSGGDC